MKTLSAKNIQIFVSGALTISGFRSLMALPFLYVGLRNVTHLYPIVSSVALAIFFTLALPLGIGLLLNQPRFFRWTQVYLLLEMAIRLFLSLFYDSGPPTYRHDPWTNALIPVVLLGLLIWSHSNRFKNEPVA